MVHHVITNPDIDEQYVAMFRERGVDVILSD